MKANHFDQLKRSEKSCSEQIDGKRMEMDKEMRLIPLERRRWRCGDRIGPPLATNESTISVSEETIEDFVEIGFPKRSLGFGIGSRGF